MYETVALIVKLVTLTTKFNRQFFFKFYDFNGKPEKTPKPEIWEPMLLLSHGTVAVTDKVGNINFLMQHHPRVPKNILIAIYLQYLAIYILAIYIAGAW
jgi:hypothetical protein